MSTLVLLVVLLFVAVAVAVSVVVVVFAVGIFLCARDDNASDDTSVSFAALSLALLVADFDTVAVEDADFDAFPTIISLPSLSVIFNARLSLGCTAAFANELMGMGIVRDDDC